MKTKAVRAAVIMIVVIILLLIVASASTVTVPTGHTGVVTTLGRVEDYVLDEGLHFKLPWQSVVKMDNRALKETLTTQAFSSDIQQVDVIVSVNYSVDRETSQKLFRNVGANYYTTVMEPRIFETVKAVFAKYTAENLIASRNTLSSAVSDSLAPEMKTYGIQILNISIENIDFTDAFTDAVEQKQVAEQNKLRSKTEQEQATLIAEEEAKRRRIAAEAEADVSKIRADAEKYADEKQAEANKMLAESMTDALIRYYYVQQWDGKLPGIYSGEGLMPVIDIPLPETYAETPAEQPEEAK